jgi:hypothetical protein
MAKDRNCTTAALSQPRYEHLDLQTLRSSRPSPAASGSRLVVSSALSGGLCRDTGGFLRSCFGPTRLIDCIPGFSGRTECVLDIPTQSGLLLAATFDAVNTFAKDRSGACCCSTRLGD